MATRRPRIKAAAILKPRRIPTASSSTDQNNANDTIKSELNVEAKPDISFEARSSVINNTVLTTSTIGRLRPSDIKSVSAFALKKNTNGFAGDGSNDVDEIDNVQMPFKSPTPNPEYDLISSKTPRRLSTPTVNMVNRRKNSESHSIGMPSPNYLKSLSYQSSLLTRPVQASPYHGSNTPKTPNIDDEVFSPIPAEGDFKPPFMSPSAYTRRTEPSMSPFHDSYNEDYAKSPSSVASSKVRQRIRPTPCFASRRNSVNCSAASDVEDDQNRRQRHYSTSSTHSNYNPAMTPQHNRAFPSLGKQITRVRTESYSSTISDAPYPREMSSKLKRSHRSEEYQRVANAKREFNQRLNGKPPDKSRLTMYDLIYYNPLTNPMSKPAGKGDKSSDTASVSSTRTNQSRSSGSVKSEASSNSGPVKAEHNDPVTEPMPVPQLKLGANGEIVLDEKSLVIETTTDKEAREILANTEVVYDDEFTGTSGFYKRQKRTRDWLPLETIKFYRSLQTIGTDFSVMLQLFPNRSRRDLKLKFKKEEKYNMALINKALLHPKEFNVDELKLQFDKEDEEIELKRQEWADVRKKIHTDRKKQLTISKKRNPSKHISASMRNLTDGDLIYEHEFVSLPKTRRQKRKRHSSTDTLDECATNPQSVHDAIQSPVPLIYNNNHVETLPVHTYATHKLPSIIEMLSNRKKCSAPVSYASQAVPNGIENHKETSQIEMDSSIKPIEPNESTEKELRVNDQHPEENIISATSTIQENGSNHLILNNETLINRLGDKNPNLSLKGESNDIMNMDIIFENVPIEEDTSVIVETQSSPMTHSPTIDGVQYEIITLNDDNQTPTINNETNVIDMDEISAETATVMATEMAIGTDASCGVYASNEVVIADHSQSMEVATHIETGKNNYRSDEENPVNGDTEITHPTDDSNAKHYSQPIIIIDDKKFELPIEQSESKIPCEQKSPKKEEKTPNNTKAEVSQEMCDAEKPIANSILDRKRKRKPVPVLNKRPRRMNLVITPEPKVQNERADADAEPLKVQQVVEEPVANEKIENASPADVGVDTKQEVTSNENEISDSIEQNVEGSVDAKDCDQNENTQNEANQSIEPESREPADQDEGDSDENSFMNSLVVVESQDPNDLSKTLYEVFVVDPVTKEMSEKPLDLPDDVIQRIRLSM